MNENNAIMKLASFRYRFDSIRFDATGFDSHTQLSEESNTGGTALPDAAGNL